jgi:hypothetical protein
MSLTDEIKALIRLSGLDSFVPNAHCYRSDNPAALVVALPDIATPINRTIVDQSRAVSILNAVAHGLALPPVEICELAPTAAGCRYRLHNGFHRYHLSSALGFSHIPAVVRDCD